MRRGLAILGCLVLAAGAALAEGGGAAHTARHRVEGVHDLAVGGAVGTLLHLGVVELKQLVEPREKLVLAYKEGRVHHANVRHCCLSSLAVCSWLAASAFQVNAVRGIFKFWIQKRPRVQNKNTDKIFLLQSLSLSSCN
jgi:hypothetical protein